MGAQNTTQRLTAAIGPPVFGEVIEVSSYPLAFAVCGLFPLLAWLIVAQQHARAHARAAG